MLQFYLIRGLMEIKFQGLKSFNMKNSQLPTENTPSRFDDSKLCFLNNSHLSYLTEQDQATNQKQQIQTGIPDNIQRIIEKKPIDRTSLQNSIVNKYLLRCKIFKKLVEVLTHDVVKQMLRMGQVKTIYPGDVLFNQDKRVKTVHILLFGQIGVAKDYTSLQQSQEAMSVWELLDQLVEKLGRETKYFKLRSQAISKKYSLESSNLQRSLLLRKQTNNQNMDIDYENLPKIHPECFLDYLPLLQYEPKQLATMMAITESVTFDISLQQFYECLMMNYDAKMHQLIKMFRKVPIFNAFQISKLKILIQKLKIIEIKKNEFVYKQGDQPACMYMLIEGQIQISKTIEVFAQNPNNLYKNRVKVSKSRLYDNIKLLPYADFNGVYNYQPQEKLINLSLLNPICIFGEQEIIQKSVRQVNAKVLSLTSKMYEIHLEDIEDVCNKMINSNGQKKLTLVDFLAMVQQSITLKKILLRQNQLSVLVDHQNRNKYKTMFDDSIKSKSNRKSYAGRKTSSHYRNRQSHYRADDEALPTYNNFNYNDFMTPDNQEEINITVTAGSLNEAETKVIKLTHIKYSTPTPNTNKTKDKKISVRNFSRRNTSSSSKKASLDNMTTIESFSSVTFQQDHKVKAKSVPKINLQNPLFNTMYFQKQQKEERRLYVEAKKKKLEAIYRNSHQKFIF